MEQIELNPNPTQAIVKGRVTVEGTYILAIPDEVAKEFRLTGDEHFIMLSRPELDRIIIKPVELVETEEP